MHLSLKFASLATATFLAIAVPSFPFSSFQSAAIAQTTQDRKAEGDRLFRQGDYAVQDRNYSTAIRYYQEALEIYQQIGEIQGQIDALEWIGIAYDSQGNFEKAIDYAQRGLTLAQRISDDYQEVNLLMVLSEIYESQANFAKAVGYAQQSWRVAQKIKDSESRRLAQSSSLTRLILVYSKLGDETKADEYRAIAKRLEEQRLAQERQQLLQTNPQGNGKMDMDALASLASNYKLQGDYSGLQSDYIKAASYYIQAIAAARKILDHSHESDYLNELGYLYLFNLNDPRQAINYYKQQLVVAQKNSAQSLALLGLAQSYSALTLHDEAINYYEKLLAQARERRDRFYEPIALDGLASEYFRAGNYTKAAEYYKLKIFFAEEGKSYLALIEAWFNLGKTYQAMSNYSMAVEAYQQPLMLAQTNQDRRHEVQALKNIGDVFVEQNQAPLATVFYKKAVNLSETIRQDLKPLPKQQQEAYTRLVADTYRTLANLLIQQRRLPEAQAVLELLKLQELRDFTRDAGINSTGISLAKVEETALNQILKQFTTLGNFAQVIAKCEKEQCSTLNQLEQQRDNLYIAVNQELDQQRATLAKYFATEPGTLLSDKLNAEARNIVNSQPGTVLIYPLVLKDKIQFLLALKTGDGAVTFRPFEITISADKLFTQIQTFRNQLKSPGDLKQLQATSQELYQALIQPLEPELNNPQVKHLVFAPDSIIRYIPLAALYNGKQYLIQRFSISTITAASKTDTTDTTPKPTANQSLLLAMGASTFPNLPPLDSVPVELNAITRTDQSQDSQGIYPGRELLNGEFDYSALKANLKTGTYRILHIATHGAFKPGRPEDSYLVPGRGENLTTSLIDALGNYGLHKIHLVVLSACETAVGDRASDGIEIPGISYFFLKNEVKSVLASLWSVSDASTALLMQQFYQHLAQGKTKAEALQLVQQDFIQGKLTVKDAEGLNRAGARRHLEGQLPVNSLAHPYYWAPFILIGNSL